MKDVSRLFINSICVLISFSPGFVPYQCSLGAELNLTNQHNARTLTVDSLKEHPDSLGLLNSDHTLLICVIKVKV